MSRWKVLEILLMVAAFSVYAESRRAGSWQSVLLIAGAWVLVGIRDYIILTKGVYR